jgi:hypothetical protein
VQLAHRQSAGAANSVRLLNAVGCVVDRNILYLYWALAAAVPAGQASAALMGAQRVSELPGAVEMVWAAPRGAAAGPGALAAAAPRAAVAASAAVTPATAAVAAEALARSWRCGFQLLRGRRQFISSAAGGRANVTDGIQAATARGETRSLMRVLSTTGRQFCTLYGSLELCIPRCNKRMLAPRFTSLSLSLPKSRPFQHVRRCSLGCVPAQPGPLVRAVGPRALGRVPPRGHRSASPGASPITQTRG